MMICDMCDNGAICRYRELFEEIRNDISDVQEIVQEKAKELPEFASLDVNLTCKYFKSRSFLQTQPSQPIPTTTYVPSQFIYTPFSGIQPIYSGRKPTTCIFWSETNNVTNP